MENENGNSQETSSQETSSQETSSQETSSQESLSEEKAGSQESCSQKAGSQKGRSEEKAGSQKDQQGYFGRVALPRKGRSSSALLVFTPNLHDNPCSARGCCDFLKKPLHKSSVSRVAAIFAMIARSELRRIAVAYSQGERQSKRANRALPLGALALRATGCVARFAKGIPFAAPRALPSIPQSQVRGHVGLVQRFPKSGRSSPIPGK